MDQLEWLLAQVRDAKKTGEGWKGRCPFHEDRDPSCSVYESKDVAGLYIVHCFSTGCRLNTATNAWGLAKLLGVQCPCESKPGEPVGGRRKGKKTSEKGPEPAPLPSEAEVRARQEALRRTPEILRRLREEWLVTDDVIERYELGWDDKRVWIPVRDEKWTLVNVRKYRFDAEHASKYKGVRGHNEARLYPQQVFAGDPPWLLLCEGEKDCLCAVSQGLPAVTATGGSGTWTDEFSERLRGKQVAVCYDVDEAGRTGAQKVRAKLTGIAATVKVLKLPPERLPANGDLTDWFHVGGSFDAFLELLRSTPEATSDVARRRADGEPARITLAASQDALKSWQPVEVEGQVVGKDVEPYIVPRKLVLRCALTGKKCVGCAIRERGRETDLGWVLEVDIEERSDEYLRLIRVSREKRSMELSKILELGCSNFRIDREESVVLEEIYVSDEVDAPRIVRSDREEDPEIGERISRGEPTLVRAHLVVHGGHRIATNQAFRFRGTFLADPRTQEGVHILWEAAPVRESISAFRTTPAEIDLLRLFRCTPNGASSASSGAEEAKKEGPDDSSKSEGA